jgi:hypothetical protein
MISSRIVDGKGSGNSARVYDEGTVGVLVHPHPPKDDADHPIPFRQYAKNSAGAFDMRVDGSTTPQEFYVEPAPERNLYVGRIDFLVSDASATLDKFGALTALTNGVKVEWVTDDFGTVEVHDGLKTNFDFIRLSGGKPSFGDGATAFRANNMSGSSEGYLASVDLDEIFGTQWGLRLRKGTLDRLVITIQDDITGVDQFDAVIYGLEF